MLTGPHVLTIQFSSNAFPHMTFAQYGAFAAWIMKCENFQHINISRTSIEIGFTLKAWRDESVEPCVKTRVADQIEKIYAEVAVFVELEPFPCPCGCGSFLSLGPCFQQSGEIQASEYLRADLPPLTLDEIDLCLQHNKIAAIKSLRVRTGVNLREAKEATEQYFPSNGVFPTLTGRRLDLAGEGVGIVRYRGEPDSHFHERIEIERKKYNLR